MAAILDVLPQVLIHNFNCWCRTFKAIISSPLCQIVRIGLVNLDQLTPSPPDILTNAIS